MKKNNTKINKGKGIGKSKPPILPKRKYVRRNYTRKGGIEQPVQQQGVIGTALTDLKNNKEMFTPVYDTAVNAYDTASNIGLLYNFGGAVMSTIFASLFIYGGVMIKNYYGAYTEKTTATIVSADCFHVDKKKEKKCDVIIEYEVEGTKYKKDYTSYDVVNVNQTLTIYYDPKNPNNFTTIYDMLYYFGWALIIGGICGILTTWGLFIMSWLFKPVAALSGVNAVGDILTPTNFTGNVGNVGNVGNYGDNMGYNGENYNTNNN
jgi:hypothetical protein